MNDQNEIQIHLPRTGDGAGLVQSWLDAGIYYNQLAPGLFQISEEEGLASWFEDGHLHGHSDELYLVAVCSGQAVGFIEAAIESPIATPARQFVRNLGCYRLNIHVLVVQHAYWRHGIWKKLLAAAEDWGRSQGASMAILNTFIESPVSIPFFEELMGYQRRSIYFQKILEWCSVTLLRASP